MIHSAPAQENHQTSLQNLKWQTYSNAAIMEEE
jgi:hypothetical protein